MVIPLGALVNGGAIVAGGLIGLAAGSVIGERTRQTLLQALGLCSVLIGLNMAMPVANLMVVIVSLVLGAGAGELLGLDRRLQALGDKCKGLLRSQNDRFTEGLVTYTLIAGVGAMAIVGSFEEGLGGSPNTLFSKSILDFCSAMMLGSVYGGGVVVAGLPIFLYEGALTLLAAVVEPLMTGPVKAAMISTGGLMIVAIGTNLMGVKNIAVSNLLPGLAFAVALGAVFG